MWLWATPPRRSDQEDGGSPTRLPRRRFIVLLRFSVSSLPPLESVSITWTPDTSRPNANWSMQRPSGLKVATGERRRRCRRPSSHGWPPLGTPKHSMGRPSSRSALHLTAAFTPTGDAEDRSRPRLGPERARDGYG